MRSGYSSRTLEISSVPMPEPVPPPIDWHTLRVATKPKEREGGKRKEPLKRCFQGLSLALSHCLLLSVWVGGGCSPDRREGKVEVVTGPGRLSAFACLPAPPSSLPPPSTTVLVRIIPTCAVLTGSPAAARSPLPACASRPSLCSNTRRRQAPVIAHTHTHGERME